MVRENEIRRAEVAIEMPPTTDAGLVFIGRIYLAHGNAEAGPSRRAALPDRGVRAVGRSARQRFSIRAN